MMSFPKKYKFDESEKKWQIFWQEKNKHIIAQKIFEHYIENCIIKKNLDDLISVYTVTCNIKNRIKQSFIN